MRKRIALMMTALVMIIGLSKGNVGVDVVSAEEIEKNVKLTIESKDIDINEIPENREVEVLVSIENNPGVALLGFTIEVDSPIKDPDKEYLRELDESYGVTGKIYPLGIVYANDECFEVQLDVFPDNPLFCDDGPFLYLVFKVPYDAKVGDVYHINFVTGNVHSLMGWFTPDRFNLYEEEYFSEFNSGYIRITGESNEQITRSPDNHDIIDSDSGNNSQLTSESKETEPVIMETVPSTVAPVTTSTAVSTTTSSPVESTTAPVTSTSVNSETTKPETVISTVSATVTNETTTEYVDIDDNEDKKEKKQGFPVIIIVAVLAVAVVLGIIKGRRKQ